MTDDKSKRGPGPAAPVGGKRPYATIDLKATEFRVTPIAEKAASAASASSASASVPLPLPASSYATRETLQPKAAATAAAAAAAGAISGTSSSAKSTAEGARPTMAKPLEAEPVIVKKGGGFFSHLAAGIIGGVLAVSASEWALPQLGVIGPTSRLADDTAAIAARIGKLEAANKTGGTAAAPSVDAKAVQAIESRLADLEKTAATIPALTESQSRLVAETKATLAGAASDSGAPELVTRLAKLEGQLKALEDAGASDPNAGRLEQVAALTGKVSDLETALATQLTELRKSVGADVEARITAATEASEAAKSGTQRIDRDVATVKSDAIRIEERLQALKAETDRAVAAAKLNEERASALQASLENLGQSTAKSIDIAAAVGPVAGKMTLLERRVEDVVKAEGERRASAENVVVALQLQNLKRALERGDGFGAELADLRSVAGGRIDLAALDKVKETGVPSATTLAKDFRSTANAALDAELEPADGGVVDRLWAGAKSIVRVRKVNHEADDTSTEAIIGRMDVALKEQRLTDVLTEAKALSPKAQDAARPFLDRVAARVSVDAAVAAIESQLKSSIAPAAAEPAKSAP